MFDVTEISWIILIDKYSLQMYTLWDKIFSSNSVTKNRYELISSNIFRSNKNPYYWIFSKYLLFI